MFFIFAFRWPLSAGTHFLASWAMICLPWLKHRKAKNTNNLPLPNTNSEDTMENIAWLSWLNLHNLANSIFYALIGSILLVLGFIVYEKMTPSGMWKEIIEDQNIALAIIVGATVLGISNIVASAIHG